MSQADNLAALGSNVNTSGVLQPAGGGTGTTTATGTGSVVLSSGATLTNATINGAVASGFTMKNRIINGDMVIDQRNAGASIASGYPVDRFTVDVSQSSKLTTQQNAGSVTPPAGFTKYLGVTSSSAYSVTSSDFFLISQRIEGFNVADLNWGTANAATVTLSFWVRSSLTGTFGGSLRNNDDTRSYVFSYTISAANTWEQKTITIPGDTTGTWNTTTGRGINLSLGLGIGSSLSTTAGSWVAGSFLNVTGAVSVVGTNGATLYITGVQLERGSQATSFEWLPYGTELSLCQRYFQKNGQAQGIWYTNQYMRYSDYIKVTMRSSPSLSIIDSNAYHEYLNQAGYNGISTVVNQSNDASNVVNMQVYSSINRGRSYGDPAMIYGNVIGYSAEL